MIKAASKYFTMGFIFFSLTLVLVSFQNCSSDAGFNANPDVARPFSNIGSPRFGGNEDIVVRLNEYPTDTTIDNSDAVVDFEVTSPNGEIEEVNCYLDDEKIDCDPRDTIALTDLGLGTHTFTIEGRNDQGQTGSETITWTIFETIVKLSKEINVTGVNDIADIIINVDNSGSMKEEQRNMAARVANLMDRFANLDYRISVVTTSPTKNDDSPDLYYDGNMIKFPDGSYCLTPALDKATAQQYLKDTVQRAEKGSGDERGIFTSYRAFERGQAGGSPESSCLRDGVAKHVIVISDEDETLKDGGNNLPNQNKSVASNLSTYISDNYGGASFILHSIIVNPYSSDNEGVSCLAAQKAQATGANAVKYGRVYADATRETGGVIGSVCAADYATQLSAIGGIIGNSAKTFQLDCVAVTGSQYPGSVTSGGANINIGWTFNGNKIEFVDNLPIANYIVDYYCFK